MIIFGRFGRDIGFRALSRSTNPGQAPLLFCDQIRERLAATSRDGSIPQHRACKIGTVVGLNADSSKSPPQESSTWPCFNLIERDFDNLELKEWAHCLANSGYVATKT